MADPAPGVQSQNIAVVEADDWGHVLSLPCLLTVDLSMPGFTVADAVMLRRSSVISSLWRVGDDVPLRLNGELIATGGLEVVGNHLALRLTELV